MSTVEQPAPGEGAPTTDPATGIQQAADDRIPLPPVPATPPDPKALLRQASGLDVVLVGIVLLFAFLAASFKASNSDVWMHLATGRLIVQGGFEWGSDPYTFGSEGGWVENAWLFDVIAYGIYRLPTIGGQALIVAKALLVVGLAWLLFRAGSMPGRRAWVPATCALLAILALSPRLLMQSIVVSFFLQGLTIYLLFTSPPGSRRLWALPVVCLVWVNMDQWFLLGPTTILLYLLGEILDPFLAPAAAGQDKKPIVTENVRTLGLVLGASVVACLISPFHVRSFTIPWLLTGAGSTLSQEPVFRAFFYSPFFNYKVYFLETFGLSVAGLSYFVLLLAGLVSFGLLALFAPDRLRASRVLLWLAMALLSVFNLRLIPFFAIAGGPIMALNYLDLAERLVNAVPVTRGERQWAIGGRVITILAGLALILASIGGYVQAQPYHLRKVAWGIETDEGLKGAALQIAEWRAQGALEPGQRWFNFSPDVVNYLAWFCPGEKGFVDQRVRPFLAVGDDLRAARQALEGEGLTRDVLEGKAEPPWRPVLRKHQARFLVIHLYDPVRQGEALARAFSSPMEFVPCYVGGKTAIFAWRDPKQWGPSGPSAIDPRVEKDFARMAFGKEAVPLPDGGGQPLAAQPWWQPLISPPGAQSSAGWEATQHYHRFVALAGRYAMTHQANWRVATLASLIGLNAQHGGPLLPGSLLVARLNQVYLFPPFQGQVPTPLDRMAMQLAFNHVRDQDSGPPDALYLAIRSARRGLLEGNQDSQSYLVLAEAYDKMLNRTRERNATSRILMREKEAPQPDWFFPHVAQIRKAQIAAALNQVLKLDAPVHRRQVAHWLLVGVYDEPGYLELHVKHLREFVKLVTARRIIPGVSADKVPEALDQLKKGLQEKERELKTAQDRYEVQSPGKPLLERAMIARRNNLPETALKLLTEADPKDLVAPGSQGESAGAFMAVQLLLAVGRVDEAREALVEAAKDPAFNRSAFGTNPFGLPAYEWFRVVLAAATGDYASADEFLAECLKGVEVVPNASRILQAMEVLLAPLPGEEKRPLNLSEFAALMVGDLILSQAPTAAGIPWQWGRFAPIRPRIPKQEIPVRSWRISLEIGTTRVLNALLVQQANLWTLRAWLALEQGRTERAREMAHKALSLPAYGFVPSIPLAALLVDLTEQHGKLGPIDRAR